MPRDRNGLSGVYAGTRNQRGAREAFQGKGELGFQTSVGSARATRPTDWNFAAMISLSNGFMMYSLAPACSAREIWSMLFSVVQNTTLGKSPPGRRRRWPRNSK